MKISFEKRTGLTLIEILVIIAIILILAGLLLPALLQKPIKKAQRITCINNLREVSLGLRLWAGDNGDKYPMHVSTNLGGTMEFVESPDAFRHLQVLSNELGTPKLTICPQDIGRKYSSNFHEFSNLHISYFVGVDVDKTNGNRILSGDRHITNGFAPKNGILNLMTNQNVRWSKELHDDKNNVVLADGSAWQVSSRKLQKEILPKTGFTTNRITVP